MNPTTNKIKFLNYLVIQFNAHFRSLQLLISGRKCIKIITKKKTKHNTLYAFSNKDHCTMFVILKMAIETAFLVVLCHALSLLE